MAVNIPEREWIANARMLAREAYESGDTIRLRVRYVGELRAICISNYREADAPEIREREITELRWWLAEQGVKELACESYPYSGPDAGSTCVMLIDARKDRTADVEQWVEGVARYVDRQFCNQPVDEPAASKSAEGFR